MSVLDNQSRLNASASLFAPAGSSGGGGSIGANPSFSTIAFPPAVTTPSGPTAGGILMSQQLIIDDLATAIAGDFAFTAALPYANGLAGATSTTAFTIFAPQNGCTLAIGCGEDEVIYIDGAAGGGDPGVAVRGVGNVSISSMTISSINGAVPGGGGGAAVSTFTNLTVSSGTVALGGTLSISGQDPNLYQFTVFDSNVSSIAALSLGTVGGRNQFNAAVGEIPAFYTSTITGTTGVIQLNPTGTEQIRIGGLGAPGDITLNTVGGGSIILNGAASAPITASISSLTVSSINGATPGGGGAPNLTLSTLNLTGGANALNLQSDNLGSVNIWATGATGINLSTVTLLNQGNPLISPTGMYDSRGWMNSGYVQDVPYTSTILFNTPYSNDNICVMLTPTNRGVSSGQNPALSLATAYGTLGTGVSSIGFSVDARNGGVGYAASFYYLAFPRNS